MTFIKNWFSNMLPFDKPLIYQGIEYYTAENFYQAMKLPKNAIDKRRYIASLDPYGAKREGRKLQIRSDWEEIKLEVMEYALMFKFAPGTSWHSKLMATKGDIVEWNNWGDKFWGIAVDSVKIWYWFCITYACGAVITNPDNIVIDTCPIYQWMMNMPLWKILLLLRGEKEYIDHRVLNGEGQNHLGKILMKLREEFRNER